MKQNERMCFQIAGLVDGSSDLTPLDYFLWGYLKERVYQDRPENIEDLKTKIGVEIHNLPAEVIRNAVEKNYRLGEYQRVNGEHF